jgi:hypothetical protein
MKLPVLQVHQEEQPHLSLRVAHFFSEWILSKTLRSFWMKANFLCVCVYLGL